MHPLAEIRPLQISDLDAVKEFCDKNIGLNYYSTAELENAYQRSVKNGIVCSHVLVSADNEIVGVRLTYAPGLWTKGKGKGIRTDLWKVSPDEVGYFQSLFVADEFQGSGWGKKLSQAAIVALKKLGTKAVVTHSWLESPNNSSKRYLTQMGFETVAIHPEYWKDVDYECTRDGKPCLCTAEEMILYF